MYNALESLQAFEAGQGQRKAREQETAMKGIGNALAGGDYKGASASLFGMGNVDGGLKVAEYGKGLEDAEAEKKRQGLIGLGMKYLQLPEIQRRQSRDQIVQELAQFGVQMDPQQALGMDLSDRGIKATLATLQDPESLMKNYQAMMAPAEYMAPIEGVDAKGNPTYYQPSKTGQGRAITDIMPIKQEADYGSAADATGVRRYTEGPNIGQPVPGFETPRPDRGGMQVSVDENGNPVIVFGGPGQGSAFGSRGDSVGASAFGESLTDAGTADNTLALFNRAESILKGGYNSGALAGIKGQTGAVLNDFGFEIPGLSTGSAVADYEEFSSINKQLAAQMLKLFGGSDTERELAISITSNIGPGMADETNDRMVAAGKQIIERQRAKPEYIAQWTRRYGSLDAINPETGLGFQGTWDRFLQEQMSTLTGAASDTRQTGVEGAAQGALPADKMRRLEELRAKRDAGRLQ